MIKKDVDVKTPDGVVDATLYQPDGSGKWPGVVMLTDIMGVRPGFNEMAERLAGYGFVVLMPNIYYRSGRNPLFDHVPSSQDPVDRPKLLAFGEKLTVAAQERDGAAYVDYLKSLPQVKGKIGVVGYCLTGPTAVYTAAVRPDAVGSALSFHGVRLATEAPDSPHTYLPRVKARLYFGHGMEDNTCPPEMIAKLEAEIKRLGSDAESETYNAHHGFAVNHGRRYDQPAAEKHWDKMVSLFKQTLN